MNTNELLQPLLLFKEQFTFVPNVVHKEKLVPKSRALVCGMGGSAISSSFLTLLFPDIDISLHNSYGLPKNVSDDTLVIINSYSGNTEEALDSFSTAVKEGVSVLVITKGGKLLELARERATPHIELPESSLEPRFAIGHQMMAILTAMEKDTKITLLRESASQINTERILEAGTVLSNRLSNKYPVLYSPPLLLPLTYPIKAAINEGAKLPSFVNVIPEANHNELQGFVVDGERNESSAFGFLFFTSPFDHARIQKRIRTMHELYSSKGFVCEEVVVDHTTPLALLEALLLGYAFATSLAINRGVPPYITPFIQEFKAKMSE